MRGRSRSACSMVSTFSFVRPWKLTSCGFGPSHSGSSLKHRCGFSAGRRLSCLPVSLPLLRFGCPCRTFPSICLPKPPCFTLLVASDPPFCSINRHLVDRIRVPHACSLKWTRAFLCRPKCSFLSPETSCWQALEFESVPLFCSMCWHQGHVSSSCKNRRRLRRAYPNGWRGGARGGDGQ